MRFPGVRRQLAGIGIVVVAFTTMVVPAAAAAPPNELVLGVMAADLVVAVGGPRTEPALTLTSSREANLADEIWTFDVDPGSALQVVAGYDSRCESPHAGRLVCADTDQSIFEGRAQEYVTAEVRPVKGAKIGATARITATLSGTEMSGSEQSGSELKPISTTFKAVVGGKADLADASPAVKGRLGAAVRLPLKVRNAGSTTVTGFAAFFLGSPSLPTTTKYRNCTYDGDILRTCRFDRRLRAKRTYGTTLPAKVLRDVYSPGSIWQSVTWSTAAEFDALVRSKEDEYGIKRGVPGKGGLLKLGLAPTTAAKPQTDVRPDNDNGGPEVELSQNNGADLQALGSRVTGVTGAVVAVTVGARNNGPAVVGDHQYDEREWLFVTVTVPPGTTAVTVDRRCMPSDGKHIDWDTIWEHGGEPGAPAYICVTAGGEDGSFDVGESDTAWLDLRIDTVITGASGRVALDVDPRWGNDPKRANNTAALVVNPIP
jgi:hypothetical protein